MRRGAQALLPEHPLDFSKIGLDFDGPVGSRRRWLQLLVIPQELARVFEDVTSENGYHSLGWLYYSRGDQVPKPGQGNRAGRFAANA